MNTNISRLHAIASKPARLIIGLMSGTSLDGIDIALCEIKGSGLETVLSLKAFKTVTYSDDFKNEVRSVFSKKEVDLQKLCLLNEYLGKTHAAIVNETLQKWNINNADVDMIASHGQTIYHAPKSLHGIEKFSNGSLQIGDGDHIAVSTGITCISDFRQKHLAAGGEGAPLAAYGDYILFNSKSTDRLLLNIGGIANLTYIPALDKDVHILCTDIGPGNTLMDAYTRLHFPAKYFDENGTIARSGIVNEDLLAAFKDHDFFRLAFPKTTGPELFNLDYLEQAMQKTNTSISVTNCLCTLNKFTADIIADAINEACLPNQKPEIYCSGGGIHNQLLMQQIKSQLLDFSFIDMSVYGIDPDAKESVLFAVLANECIAGDPAIFAKTGLPAITMGKISFPS